MQEYIQKVKEWIEQGRLSLPPGSVAIVQQKEEGSSEFVLEVEFTDKDHPPYVRSKTISV